MNRRTFVKLIAATTATLSIGLRGQVDPIPDGTPITSWCPSIDACGYLVYDSNGINKLQEGGWVTYEHCGSLVPTPIDS